MTRLEAVAIYDSGQWQDWTPIEKVMCQLYEERLIMPFSEFKKALSQTLGREVFLHEFANAEKLEAEFEGFIGPVSLQESLSDAVNLIISARPKK